MNLVRQKYFRFWFVYGLLVAFLFTLAMSYRLRVPPNPKLAIITTPTVTPVKQFISKPTTTPIPTPTIPIAQVKPVEGKSYGVFFPYNQGVTINNNQPTIIGKVLQNTNLFLDTQFGLEISPASGDEEYFLRFNPGKTKNLVVKIDGVEIKDVYGIPQYPTILCKTYRDHINNFSSDIVYDTQNECLKAKRNEVPSLIFFAGPSSPLSDGPHTITVEGNGTSKLMTFSINPAFHLSNQQVFVTNSQSYSPYPLIRSDSCTPGYYYDKKHLLFPLPSFENPNLLYGLSFPQSKDEYGSINRRQVFISFGNTRFNLFFPQRRVFYEGNLTNPYHELYLPLEQLVFSDGSKAMYQKGFEDPSYYISGYFEIFPIDITGGQYRNSSIPFTLTGSSSCDG